MNDREFGQLIMRLINKENLTREETRDAFSVILEDKTTEMQQGAFLAALCSKGETREEVAGAWEAIYELDTAKVTVDTDTPLVENSGTGMDSFKTFNISTAASLVAAAGGVKMARHGARALTSVCGTVDMAEALGVDVECPVEIVARSILSAGIGLFNGMSPHVHPWALARILSKIHFGSTLNIAASLANPALPNIGVRGVYSKDLLLPVADVMHAIGYTKAIVFYGEINGTDLGIDEASVCGKTHLVEIDPDDKSRQFVLSPEELDLGPHQPDELMPDKDMNKEAARFVRLLQGKESGARVDATILNAALIFYISGKSNTIEHAVSLSREIIQAGDAYKVLEQWVQTQNRDPKKGLSRLKALSN